MTPHHAHIEPTTLCNLQCRSCNNDGLPPRRRGHLSLSALKSLIEKNRFLKDVSLIGLGEPLLNPELADMAAYLHEEGIVARTGTNGMNLHKADLEKLLSSVVELVVSFDSADEQSFHEIRQGADFKQIIKNVEKAVAVKKKHGLPVLLSFQTVISKKNFHLLEEIPPLASAVGVDKMRFSAAVQYNPHTEHTENNPAYEKIRERIKSLGKNAEEEIPKENLKNNLKSLCDHYKLEFSFSGFDPRFRECWWPGKGIFITFDGYLTPCCMRMDPDVFNFGNLFHQSFEEIRQGDKYSRFLKFFEHGRCPEICNECPL